MRYCRSWGQAAQCGPFWHGDYLELRKWKYCRLRKTFAPPLTTKMNLNWRILQSKDYNQRYILSEFWVTHINGRTNIYLPNIYSSSSPCELLSFPLKFQTSIPFSFVQNGIYTTFCLTIFEISMSVWICHMYTSKFYFPLLICLTSIWFLVQLERPLKRLVFLLLYNIKTD